MSRVRANRIVNRAASGPIELSEGIAIPADKPLKIAEDSGVSGQFLKTTGTGLEWSNLPVATYNTFGLVKPGSTFSISSNGTLEVSGTTYVLPKASPTILGGVKVGSFLSIDADGVLSANGNYNNLTNKPTLKTVSVTGDYNDLINKPIINQIPENVVLENESPTFTNLTVTGNLVVQGTTTTANVATLNVNNNEVVLNDNLTGSPVVNAAITVNRGSANDTRLRWNEATDRWEFTNDGTVYQNIPIPSEYGNYQNLLNKPSIPQTIDELTDVSTSGAVADQILKYNGTTWESATISSVLPPASASTIGGIKVGNNLIVAPDGTLNAVAASYTLPTASSTVLGGVKVGNNLQITAEGVLNATASPYTLPIATAFNLGGIKVDGTSIIIDNFGVISATGSTADADGGYLLPKASSSTLGGIKVGNNLSINEDGVLSATATPYSLPIASSTVLGGIKVGSYLSIDGNGVLSASPYTLPTASTTVLGGVKVGTNLSITAEGVLNAAGYTLPIASGGTLGGVKVGANLVISGDGVLSATTYTLPIATGGSLGGIKVGNSLAISNGVLDYILPTASPTGLGGVKVDGTSIVINGNGVISATGGGGGGSYTLPPATGSILGGVKVGGGLAVTVDGTLSVVPGVATLPTRTTVVQTGQSAPANGFLLPDFTMTGSSFVILSVTSTQDVWVRLYTSDAARSADLNRLITVDPEPGIGLICETIYNGKQLVTPAAIGFNSESPKQNKMYAAIQSHTGSSVPVTVTIEYLPIEAPA